MAELSELANLPSAPPPPPEVKVRTMRSDLESMAKTGGGMPRFENVPVSGASITRGNAAGEPTEKKNPMMVIIIALVALAAVGAVGYFAYITFFATPSSAPQTVATSTSSGAGANNTPAVPTHQSLFKNPADQMLAITFLAQGSVQSAADLKTYSQKMLGALATVDPNSTFIEVDAQGSDGHDLTIEELLAEASAPIIDPQFLATHFNPDATFFVYKDQNGWWPGYVIALNPTENWLFLKSEVQKLESSPAIPNLYLNNPGTPSSGGFIDGAIAGTTVRLLPFTNATGSAFIYGWVTGNPGYLVLSTSPSGFEQVISHL